MFVAIGFIYIALAIELGWCIVDQNDVYIYEVVDIVDVYGVAIEYISL